MIRATVIDYGTGNLHSVRRAFEACGAEVTFALHPDDLMHADRLVLPGVGAFANGIDALRERGFDEAIAAYTRTGKPVLGICLGMQLLFETSEEFGHHGGLGLLQGRVTAIPQSSPDGVPHKVPHIGWNALTMPSARDSWQGTMLEGVEPSSYVYFVHSYAAQPLDAHRLADCVYNGLVLSAAVCRDNLMGCQFHPEKSGATGLRILSSFLALK